MTAKQHAPVEDLTALDSIELHKRIEEGRGERDSRARSVCWNLQRPAPNPERVAELVGLYTEAEAELEVLYAENKRRINERKAAGTWPFPDPQVQP